MAIEKQKLILIGGVVLGLMAIVMTYTYLEQQKKIAQEKAQEALSTSLNNQTAVLIAKQDIPAGSTIAAGMFGSKIVPKEYVQPQAAIALDEVAGLITVAPIPKGEQISLSKLRKPTQATKEENLAKATPPGKRAISVIVDNIASLSGMINPGDYVDVLAVVQAPAGQTANQASVVPLFQNILVLAVGADMGSSTRAEGKPSRYAAGAIGGNTPITLALDPEQSNLIAFVQEQGKIRLTMRSPNDSQVEELAPANWDTLFRYVNPNAPVEQESAPVVDNTEYVEVLRGLNKEKVPLSQ